MCKQRLVLMEEEENWAKLHLLLLPKSLKLKNDYQEQTGLNVLPLRSLDGQRSVLIIIIAFSMFSLGGWSTWHQNATSCPEVVHSVPQTLNFQHSSTPAPSQTSTAFQKLCLDPEKNRAALCVSGKEPVCSNPPSMIKPSLQTMWRQGWRVGGKPEHQQTNTHLTIPKDGKFEALRFGPSPILGVTVKAKQCSLKSASAGFLHKRYL